MSSSSTFVRRLRGSLAAAVALGVLATVPPVVAKKAADGGAVRSGSQTGTAGASHDTDGRIAFVRNIRNGMTDVASITAAGDGLLKITSSKRNELYVDLSPDGRRVAFTRFGPSGGEIYTASITGGAVTRLTYNKVNDELPIWSPDSRRIAFVSYPQGEEDTEIFMMKADGSRRRRISTNRWDDADPRWSPDGRRLIYTAGNVERGGQDVFMSTLGEPGAVRLTERRVNDSFAEWTPDGQAIVYASQRDEQWDLYKTSIDGKTTVRLTDDPADQYGPRYSPTRDEILFVHGRLEGDEPLDQVSVMAADGSDVRTLSPAELDIFSPEWSPTGDHIAFIGQVGPWNELPEWEIFTVGRDGTNLTRLTQTRAEEFDPEWGSE